MNLALELNTGTELAYVIGLAISGILLITVTAIGFGETSVARRAINVAFGLAMLGYGFWIFFLAQPGNSIWAPYYLFFVPIGLLIRSILVHVATTRAATRAAAAARPDRQGPLG